MLFTSRNQLFQHLKESGHDGTSDSVGSLGHLCVFPYWVEEDSILGISLMTYVFSLMG